MFTFFGHDWVKCSFCINEKRFYFPFHFFSSHLQFTFHLPDAIGLDLSNSFHWQFSQYSQFLNLQLFSFQSQCIANPIAIVITLFMSFWSFMAILGFCLLGEIVTIQFDRFYETLCTNTNWHLFPIEMQRMLVIFIAFAQHSAIIRGSGQTVCRLEAFKKVSWTSKTSSKEKWQFFYSF